MVAQGPTAAHRHANSNIFIHFDGDLLRAVQRNTANIEIQREKKDVVTDKDCRVFEHNQAGRAAHAICQRAVNYSSAMRGISCAQSRAAAAALIGHRRSHSTAVASPESLRLLTFTLHHAQLKMKTCVIF